MLPQMLDISKEYLNNLAFMAVSIPDEHSCEHRSDSAIELGSSFKVFVLAEILRQIDLGQIALSDKLTVRKEDVCEASPIFAELIGKQSTFDDALIAMMGHSDNAATDILLRTISHFDVDDYILKPMGLMETAFPGSIKSIYESGYTSETRVATSTAAQMVSFYKNISSFYKQPTTTLLLRRYLLAEDNINPSGFPSDIQCYRKSGYVDLGEIGRRYNISGYLEHRERQLVFTLNATFDGIPGSKLEANLGALFQKIFRLFIGELMPGK